ncbi:DUF441 domain-containing protein [Fodinisporobacter ferrooxydans]|uniref:UPF0756 membrane protein LSG31_18025 n=1 Tax=Fodinisporobacter ferrooxydans TaxID=2901836 RepID=A0ABY4CRA6_9BACL|nr:DUF441 domain-containing protein [Alicyclobacillaceae bacterium MYW30-H2]
MSGEMMLVILIVIGIIGRASVLATAASVLLVMKLSHLDRFFPTLERRGLELGLLCLMLVVLIPLLSDRVSTKEIINSFFTIPGVLGIVGGLLATYFNGQGLGLLRSSPQLMVSIVIGSILGIVFLKGIPVGPLMAAAITALFLKLVQMFL